MRNRFQNPCKVSPSLFTSMRLMGCHKKMSSLLFCKLHIPDQNGGTMHCFGASLGGAAPESWCCNSQPQGLRHFLRTK